MEDDNPYRPSTADVAVVDGRADAVIRVTRTPSFADRTRAYRIVVDGRELAQIRADTTVDVPVRSGPHTIDVKIDWCGSPPLDCAVEPGEVLELECGSNLKGLKVFIAAFYIFLRPNHYLTLELLSRKRP